MKLLTHGKTIGMIVCSVLVMIMIGALPVSSSGQRFEYGVEDDTYRPEETRGADEDGSSRGNENLEPYWPPMEPEEVAYRIAVMAKRAVEERGFEEMIDLIRRSDEANRAADMAEAERLLSDPRALEEEAEELGIDPGELEEIISGYLEETPEELTPDTGFEEEWVRWLSEAPVEEIVADFCGPYSSNSSTLKTALVGFENKYGIEFFFVGNYLCCDWWNNQKKLLNHPDLPEVLAQISNYPDDILKYLGKEEGLEVYLYEAGANAFCFSGAEACYNGVFEEIYIEEGHAASTVHEVAHAIKHLMIDSNQGYNDGANPLWGSKKGEEFQGAFEIPSKWQGSGISSLWEGKVKYSMFHGDPPDPLPSELQAGPPSGFLEVYSMINMHENFAVAVGTYAAEDEVGAFIDQAKEELWEENIRLYRQYRFIYEYIFKGAPKCSTKPELYDPLSGLAAFSLQSDGNGNGRVEPGESFSVKVTFVLGRDSMYVKCRPRLPSEVTTQSTFFNPVYNPPEGKVLNLTWDFILPKTFKEKNQIFDLVGYDKGEYIIASWVLPLNEQGYLWTWSGDDGLFIKLTSTLHPVEAIDPGASIWSEAWPGSPEEKNVIFDPDQERFWVANEDQKGTIGFIPRQMPSLFVPVPINPDGKLVVNADGVVEVTQIKRNPYDGAIWAGLNDNGAIRIMPSPAKAFGAAPWPGAEKELITLNTEEFYWKNTDLDFNPENGEVWIAGTYGGEGQVLRLSASGKKVKIWLNGFDKAGLDSLTCVAAAADGGCWAGGKQKLLKISKSGALTELDGILKMYHYLNLRTHPVDGSLWAVAFIEQPDGSKPEHLLRVSAKGELLSVWPLSGGGAEGIVPCTTDTSVFVYFSDSIERYHPEEAQPVFTYENEYSSDNFPILAYLPNYTLTPLDLNLIQDPVDPAFDPMKMKEGPSLPKEFEGMFP